jgi:dipeptide transport system permease protein
LAAQTENLPIKRSLPLHPLHETWLYFCENKGALAGLIVIVTLCLVAMFANLIAPYSPIDQYPDCQLLPPAWQDRDPADFAQCTAQSQYLLGTDPAGRDMLSRLIFGARLSLLIGANVVTISLAVGIVLGLIAGFFRGVVDILIMRAMDMLLALPSLLLAIVIVTILGPSLTNAMIAVAIVTLPHYVRLMRAAVLTEVSKDYVIASRVSGAGLLRQMFITVLPNCLAPLIVQATLGFSSAILDAAALGFLGLGAQPPTPEWGTMLSGSLGYMQRAPWVVTFPGLAILITVLAFNLMGDGLRDALDPKLKR